MRILDEDHCLNQGFLLWNKYQDVYSHKKIIILITKNI